MVIRITQTSNGWFWIMETTRGDTVCKSDNWRDMDSGYTRRQTAIKSAERFVDRYLDESLHVSLIDENRRHIWTINS